MLERVISILQLWWLSCGGFSLPQVLLPVSFQAATFLFLGDKEAALQLETLPDIQVREDTRNHKEMQNSSGRRVPDIIIVGSSEKCQESLLPQLCYCISVPLCQALAKGS